jgi:hypothetical protein
MGECSRSGASVRSSPRGAYGYYINSRGRVLPTEIPQCWLTGQAAGPAAALAATRGCAPRAAPIAELQALLLRQGAWASALFRQGGRGGSSDQKLLSAPPPLTAPLSSRAAEPNNTHHYPPVGAPDMLVSSKLDQHSAVIRK